MDIRCELADTSGDLDYCTVDECKHEATHEVLTDFVGDNPVVEMQCCFHTHPED